MSQTNSLWFATVYWLSTYRCLRQDSEGLRIQSCLADGGPLDFLSSTSVRCNSTIACIPLIYLTKACLKWRSCFDINYISSHNCSISQIFDSKNSTIGSSKTGTRAILAWPNRCSTIFFSFLVLEFRLIVHIRFSMH